MERASQLKEINEAIDAANVTLRHLENAKNALNSASGFGIADMLGMDFIGGIGKHMKMNQASQEIERAKDSVMSLKKELSDVETNLHIDINIGDFLTFADFFFDNMVADFMVQSKIAESKNQVDGGIYKIRTIISNLEGMKAKLR